MKQECGKEAGDATQYEQISRGPVFRPCCCRRGRGTFASIRVAGNEYDTGMAGDDVRAGRTCGGRRAAVHRQRDRGRSGAAAPSPLCVQKLRRISSGPETLSASEGETSDAPALSLTAVHDWMVASYERAPALLLGLAALLARAAARDGRGRAQPARSGRRRGRRDPDADADGRQDAFETGAAPGRYRSDRGGRRRHGSRSRARRRGHDTASAARSCASDATATTTSVSAR